jgi:hypothetical protein
MPSPNRPNVCARIEGYASSEHVDSWMRAGESDERRQLVHGLTDLDRFDADVERRGRVRPQLRQRLNAANPGDVPAGRFRTLGWPLGPLVVLREPRIELAGLPPSRQDQADHLIV